MNTKNQFMFRLNSLTVYQIHIKYPTKPSHKQNYYLAREKMCTVTIIVYLWILHNLFCPTLARWTYNLVYIFIHYLKSLLKYRFFVIKMFISP